LYRFWTLRGHFREGIAVTEALLAHNPEKQNPVCRANALNSLGIMLRHIGQQETARLHMKEALQIWRELNDLGGISSALANLGTIANNLEDFETAKIYLTEALVLSREIGREHAVAICLNNLGMIARRQGDLAAARTSLESSLTLMQSLQDAAGISQNYYNLGGLACAMGDSQTGRAYLQEALRLNLELQNPEGIAACLIAIAFSRAGDLSEAEEDANLLGVTETLREEFDIPLLTDERAEYENGAARLQAILGDARFADAVAAGRTLSRRAVLCRLLGDPDAEIAMPTVRGIAP
jgi:tetratricopeptide (TPR) repeat protein